jgi:sporulation-control protein spo0M
MSFSDRMRESLGAGGVRVELRLPPDGVEPGGHARATVTMTGGTRPARIESVIMRLEEADRHWIDEHGGRVEEEDAQTLSDRSGLTAGWSRRTIGEQRYTVGRDVEPGEQVDLDVELDVPSDARRSSVSRSHTLNVQADIPGQIDPTANARILVTT